LGGGELKAKTFAVVGVCGLLVAPNALAGDSAAKLAIGGAAGAATGKKIAAISGKVMGGAVGGPAGAAVTTKKGKGAAGLGAGAGGASGRDPGK
jgi:hypothetical protein